ncbi:hypothetical protein OG782_32685 [Streptomyces sp. NBC_00876]|uniref:ATP-grasp domain-containing protein n=1 Tax=Streptomyces sp. NBC_00876 TaxID=2975853 RepID=UPI00386944C2|nr:hypothetical protein OG782_32685 [Streptomyces sp. NBC_00876]
MTRPLRVDLLVAEDPPQHGVTLLADAHVGLGHHVRVRHLRNVLPVAGGRVLLPAPAADVAHSRASALWSLDVQEELARRGHLIVNAPSAQRAGRDKWLCTQRLLEHGVPVLPTLLVPPGADAGAVMEQLGEDLVLKPRAGHSGQGVIRRTGTEAISVELAVDPGALDARIVQPFAEAADRTDQRLIVVGGQVIAAYRRHAPEGDFRTNSGLGGALVAIRPDRAAVELAVRAAQACGLGIAGVDILESPGHGPVILECNTNCGVVVGLPTLTGRTVAHEMARYVAEQARPVG